MNKPVLSEADQARVDSYLNRPIHQVERKPFRLLLLFGVVIAVLTVLSLLSYGIAWQHGVV